MPNIKLKPKENEIISEKRFNSLLTSYSEMKIKNRGLLVTPISLGSQRHDPTIDFEKLNNSKIKIEKLIEKTTIKNLMFKDFNNLLFLIEKLIIPLDITYFKKSYTIPKKYSTLTVEQSNNKNLINNSTSFSIWTSIILEVMNIKMVVNNLDYLEIECESTIEFLALVELILGEFIRIVNDERYNYQIELLNNK